MGNLPKRLKFIGISTNFENDPRYLSLVLRQKKRGRENKNAIISVLICLLTLVAGTDTGYYVKSSEDLRCILSDKTSLPIDEIDDIIEDALKAGIFDSTIYEESKVITGDMFQEAYFSCLKQMRRRLNYPFPFLTPATKAFLADETQDGAGIDGSGCTKNGVFCEKKGDSCTKTGESCTKIEENRIELNEKEREGGITRACPHSLHTPDLSIEEEGDVRFCVEPGLQWIPEDILRSLENEVKQKMRVLIQMDAWRGKSRASIDEAIKKVSLYYAENPYLAIDILSDTIQKSSPCIFSPNDINCTAAMKKLNSLRGENKALIHNVIKSYDELEGTMCRTLWDKVISIAPAVIAEDMRNTQFLDGPNTFWMVLSSRKVEEWYKDPNVVEEICQITGPDAGGPSGGMTIRFINS